MTLENVAFGLVLAKKPMEAGRGTASWPGRRQDVAALRLLDKARLSAVYPGAARLDERVSAVLQNRQLAPEPEAIAAIVFARQARQIGRFGA
jgi:hypothetical protein